MTRKALVCEWGPILHSYGWTQDQIATVLHVSQPYLGRTLRALGVVPRRPTSIPDAFSRLTEQERTRLLVIYQTRTPT